MYCPKSGLSFAAFPQHVTCPVMDHIVGASSTSAVREIADDIPPLTLRKLPPPPSFEKKKNETYFPG